MFARKIGRLAFIKKKEKDFLKFARRLEGQEKFLVGPEKEKNEVLDLVTSLKKDMVDK